MRAMKILGLTTAMVLPLSATAMAADAVMAPPPEPPMAEMAPAPVQLWTGPYAGVFLGYNWGEVDALPGVDSDDLSGGAYAGYNWQSGRIVYGVEGDVGYSDVTVTNGAIAADQRLFGSARARVGVDFNPFLMYATGGVAASEFKAIDAVGSDKNTHLGWTAGAGVEAFVTDNVTARVEYRYTDYGSETYNLPTASFSKGYDEHSVRAGVGVKF
jgi:outer membrane immunogenic protein